MRTDEGKNIVKGWEEKEEEEENESQRKRVRDGGKEGERVPTNHSEKI